MSVHCPTNLQMRLAFSTTCSERSSLSTPLNSLSMPVSLSVLPEPKLASDSTPSNAALLDIDEILEQIMLACDPYTAIAMTQTCSYIDQRFNNEVFWKAYSLPMRSRNLLPGQNVDHIKEDTYLEYIIARARPLSWSACNLTPTLIDLDIPVFLHKRWTVRHDCFFHTESQKLYMSDEPDKNGKFSQGGQLASCNRAAQPPLLRFNTASSPATLYQAHLLLHQQWPTSCHG